MTSSEYYKNIETACMIVASNIANVELKMTDEFAQVNYSEILNGLYQFKRLLERMLSIHRYLKLSREGFERQSEEDSLKIESTHTVKSYETIHGIALQYKMQPERLRAINNILTGEVATGQILAVEIDRKAQENVFADLPIFGSLEGEGIYGKDLTSEIDTGGDGDLKVIEDSDCLIQGIKNRVTTQQGGYPMESDFGIGEGVGSEYPADLIQAFLKIRVLSQLNFDARIASVDSLEVVNEQNAVTITGKLTAINNNEITI